MELRQLCLGFDNISMAYLYLLNKLSFGNVSICVREMPTGLVTWLSPPPSPSSLPSLLQKRLRAFQHSQLAPLLRKEATARPTKDHM